MVSVGRHTAKAQPSPSPSASISTQPESSAGRSEESEIPILQPPEEIPSLGRRISRIEVISDDSSWAIPSAAMAGVSPGEILTGPLARRAVRQLQSTGLIAEATVDAIPDGSEVILRIKVVAQRVIKDLRLDDREQLAADVLRNRGVERGHAVTPEMLRDAENELEKHAASRGFPDAKAKIASRSTDDPREVVLLVELNAGVPRTLSGVRVDVEGPTSEALRNTLEKPGVIRGDRVDVEQINERARDLAQRLRARGWHSAEVTPKVYEIDGKTYTQLWVKAGPRIHLRFEGNLTLDADALADAVDVEHDPDRSPSHLASKVKNEYLKIGMLDAEVSASVRGTRADTDNDLVISVRENVRVRVAGRTYPCLPDIRELKKQGITGRAPRDIGREIDSFLEEDLPGTTLLSAVNPETVDASIGPLGVGDGTRRGITGARPAPYDYEPRFVYAPGTYDRALKHVQDLYRADGYLSAIVGPVQVLRRFCDRHSPAGLCVPIPFPHELEARCEVDAQDNPVEEQPVPTELSCKPDPAQGITCEPQLSLRIPVILGPRSILYDVVFDGVASFPESKLYELTKLNTGDAASNVKLEEARRAILEFYRDEGFAFVEVRAAFDLSPDKQRARARFTIIERQRVIVDRILIRGNNLTRASVVLQQLRFSEGDIYRQSAARRSEELLAALGVFSSVSIALDDPGVPATRKAVVVTVIERNPQYLEVRPGVSTGEGVRGLLEYGHRNLGGRAISLTLRVQLGFLPDFLIPDAKVRDNFAKLSLGDRLERRNSAGVQIPSVLHPTLRFGLDFIDVRSNSRDFGLTKQATLPALTWQPFRQLTLVLGGSVELNNVGIFSGQDVESYLTQPGISNDLSRLLRVPDGETTAISERIFAAWDRRDNPLGASRGTLISGGVEHVSAFPASDNPRGITSDFLRWTGTVAGYVRLSDKGLALALALRGGFNKQLTSTSKTYPDRLFFLGGIDSVRGFSRDSLVPQDLADKIEADSSKSSSDSTKLTIDKVAIRGGDVFINPRAELRIPLSGIFFTALFLDAGNVWVEPKNFEPYRLRYAGGTGIRANTLIGPIAFDYGINLSRRAWEDFGAFHFSIGLF
ncbi:MAG: POTRA domain-containing protein [Polyangiaceae bacterium]